MTSSIVVTPKRHFLAWKHVVWAIKRENRSNGSTWAQDREKKDRTGQDSQKSHKGVIFHLFGEKPPTEPIFTKICTVVAIPNVITCANFWAEIFRGYDFTGVEFPVFPIDSFMGLSTVQRYCVACDYNSAYLLSYCCCHCVGVSLFSPTATINTHSKCTQAQHDILNLA